MPSCHLIFPAVKCRKNPWQGPVTERRPLGTSDFTAEA